MAFSHSASDLLQTRAKFIDMLHVSGKVLVCMKLHMDCVGAVLNGGMKISPISFEAFYYHKHYSVGNRISLSGRMRPNSDIKHDIKKKKKCVCRLEIFYLHKFR